MVEFVWRASGSGRRISSANILMQRMPIHDGVRDVAEESAKQTHQHKLQRTANATGDDV